MRESAVERAVCEYAKAMGWLVLKLSGTHDRGKPDRMFLRKGVAMFIEFKAPGRMPTALQERWLRQLTEEGFVAVYTDNVQDGKRLIDKITK